MAIPAMALATPDDPPPPYSDSPPTFLSSRTSQSSESRFDQDPRRTLLLVYIHGFYGTDQSFRSFPAHLHDLLAAPLSRSHRIHSKVYPRYKTYKAIDVARDNFSAWLEPHESPTTDVLLIGHSMGGLLAAEVALKPSETSPGRFKHRILGTLSLDSPFLGLHPGIVVSGISSLFRPEAQPSTPELVAATQRPTDPNFDPPFWNDAPFRERPLLDRVTNFASKHGDEGLLNAFGNHITRHLEFGACLADYPGLVSRYTRLRALEDEDSRVRVRFANYYTLSSGRRRRPSSPDVTTPADSSSSLHGVGAAQMAGPTSLEEARPISMEEAEPIQMDQADISLPLLPAPTRPLPPDTWSLDDRQRRQAEKEWARQEKAYARALKDHAKAVREREKLAAKQARLEDKILKKQAKEEDKNLRKQAREDEKSLKRQAKKDRNQKARKKFCMPPRHADHTWVPVHMQGDEVSAHCGLFLPGPHYDALLAQVSQSIISWVNS